jgi:hypothetical protein
MNETAIIIYEQATKNSVGAYVVFTKFDYIKLLCDIFFCLVNIYKLLIYKN